MIVPYGNPGLLQGDGNPRLQIQPAPPVQLFETCTHMSPPIVAWHS